MRKGNTLVQAIRRARNSETGAPPLPKTWDEMSIPENLSSTIQGEKFLVLDERVKPDIKPDKIIIFCSKEQQDLLNGADYWVADGTFEVVQNTLFTQLFIVHALSPVGITVPCLYGLLPDKETSTYQICFDYLKSQRVSKPGCMITDFEKGIIRAFQNSYPKVKLSGCDTHFKRSLRRKLSSKDLGLASLYATNENFQTLVRYMWGLSLVPTDHIIPIWENFVSDQYEMMIKDDEEDAFDGQKDAVDEWLGYFEKTYVGSLNWRTGNRQKPWYPHSFWSKRDSILSDVAETTNAAEGYNAALKSSLSRNNTIWSLVKQLQIEENNNQRKLKDVSLGLQNNGNTAPNTARNTLRRARKEELKRLVSNFSNMSVSLFMKTVAEYYND